MKFLIIIILLAVFTGKAWSQEIISISYFQARPHTIYDSSTKTISGALYTFLENYIAPEMDVRFLWDIKPSSLPRQIKMLTHGEKDCAAVLIWTKDRSKEIVFSNKSFVHAKPVIAVLNDNSLTSINKIDDILHLKIGYATNIYLSPFMQDPRIDFDLLSSENPNEQNLKKLIFGRLDAVYIPDKAGMLSEIKRLKFDQSIKIIELPEAPVELHVVFSKGNEELADRYNIAHEKVGGKNLYWKLLNDYIAPKRP